eukprot:COSAG05_NODE_3504_length_2024_cov_1.375065_2_plen_114_part_00
MRGHPTDFSAIYPPVILFVSLDFVSGRGDAGVSTAAYGFLSRLSVLLLVCVLVFATDEPPSESAKIEALLARLPECTNRQRIDDWAVEFCYMNSKRNRSRLLNALYRATYLLR